MLERLELTNLGPAQHLELALRPRFNLITGDNGLGKTFLLDLLWWSLTGNWAGLPAWTGGRTGPEPELALKMPRWAGGGTLALEAPGDHAAQGEQRHGRLASGNPRVELHVRPDGGVGEHRPGVLRSGSPAVVLYVRADGGISICDPLRFSDGVPPVPNRLNVLDFDRGTLWDGLVVGEKVLCNGLLRDWVSWQFKDPQLFELLMRVVSSLFPEDIGPVNAGQPTRISLEDARDIPTVELSYGLVPLTHLSAGMQRILTLAYLLVWTWHEHMAAARLLLARPLPQMILLIDEVEAHLHARWQRTLVPSLSRVLDFSGRLKAYGQENVFPPAAEEVRSLRQTLSKIAGTEQAKIVAADAGLSLSRVDWAGTPELVWLEVLREAEKRGAQAWGRLLQILLERFPDQADLSGFIPNAGEDSAAFATQLVATTHAPLVLASLEPFFDPALDQISVLNQDQDGVRLQPFKWRSRGDVSAWLTSEAFGLLEARSLEAEKAIEQARAAMLEENPDQSRLRTIHDTLRAVLEDTDPFWPRWVVWASRAGLPL